MLLTLPLRTVSELNAHTHWRARQKRAASQRGVVELALRAALGRVELPVLVTMTRVAPRALDAGDNLASSQKHVRDAIAKVLGVDDRDPRVTWRTAQRKGAPKAYAVEIEIVPRPELCPACGQALAR